MLYVIAIGQITRFSTANKLPNTNGAKLLTIQSRTPGGHLVGIHQMAPPKRGSRPDNSFTTQFIDPERMKG